MGAMLELVRLPGHGDRLPRQLSGGQQQRVALARALVFRPRVLLMDEPFGALDRALRETMRAELRELHRALGITVVLVTHDQDEAMDLSDRVAVMRAGRLQQVAAPRVLYERPASAFVAGFVGESNLLDAVVLSVEGESAVLRTAGGRRLRAAGSAGARRRPRGRRCSARMRRWSSEAGPRRARGSWGSSRTWRSPGRSSAAASGSTGASGSP